MRTHYENLRAFEPPPGMSVDTIPFVPYKSGGVIERLPLLKAAPKGTLRTMACGLPLLSRPDYDVIWTQVLLPLLPLMGAAHAHLKTFPAILFTTDTTPVLMDDAHQIYYGRPSAGWAKRSLRDILLRYLLRRCAVVMSWSDWAARSLIHDYHVPAGRIRILPPGVDLAVWCVPAHRLSGDIDRTRPFRLLFVGGDFERKGGPLLVDVFQRHLRETCELHLVTKAVVTEHAGIHVYGEFGPNDAGLRRLYAECDALALPTRADCYSLASIEAMACGLPVVSCPVGGIPEIVRHGTTGFLVPPDDGQALLQAIQALVDDRERARAMGLAGRRVVEERFDNSRNTSEVFALMQQYGRRQQEPDR